MIRLIRARLGHHSELDPEDVVSDVVLRLFERADLLAEVENLTAYLFQAAGNRLIEMLRRRRATEPLPPEHADDSPDPERQAQGKEWRRLLEAALERLSPPEKAVWLAVEMDGTGFRELARRWDEPIGTLLSRKHRADRKLQRLLAGDRLP